MNYLKPLITCFNHSGYSGFLVLLLALVLLPLATAAQAINNDLAFYYGPKPPLDKLRFYQNIVIEPGSGFDPQILQSTNRNVYAYASLGEAISLNQYSKPIDKSLLIGENTKWKSLVLDQANPAWREFFLNTVITPLWEKGYRGFFLDTLDSYRLASEDPKFMKKQQDGIVATIRAIKAKYPDAKLILNRGFEVLPEIKSSINGVIAESLFGGWNNKKKEYYEISDKDRIGLLKELNTVKNMGIPVTVVDYVGPSDVEKAKEIVKKINNLGFNAWVTNGDLTEIYLFDFDLLARKILLFYQGKPNNVDEKIGSYVSKSITMPLNHMGYVTILRNIEEPLPKDISPKEYAGIIVANDGIILGKGEELYRWYLDQIHKKIPLIILNNFGFPLDNTRLSSFGLSTSTFSTPVHSIKTAVSSPMMGFEISPVFKINEFIPLSLKKGEKLLKLVDDVGTEFVVSAITPWGGYFLTNNFLVPVIASNRRNGGETHRWSIDPFAFFKQALRLPDRPIPDTTTENGRRLMFVHIDGDGFANRGQWANSPYVGKVATKEFFERYAIPTTVSIIQGEIAPNGLHPELSAKLEKIARQIFALPYIEIASHTFSHPFNWLKAAQNKDKAVNPFTLKIPNYHFNVETEVKGSVDYINENLAPLGKKCKIFLWSGEGDVPAEALKFTYQLGIANINPGRLITRYNNSITNVSPLGLNEGGYFQVFAPIGNDNETLDYNAAFFYSLVDIIGALQLTDKPRRLKPIDIYTHFYTIGQIGGIKAMHKVYDWALAQPIMNIYTSEYFNKVTDFRDLMIAKKEDGWLFATNDQLRELRMPRSMGYPDLNRSMNVIGYNFYNDDIYIHLGPGGQVLVRLTKDPATVPFLIDSNVRLKRFVRNGKRIDFSFKSELRPKFTFANMASCTLWNGKERLAHQQQEGNQKSYEFKQGMDYDLFIQCE